MTEVVLTWQPDFVDVSDDGSLAYTFGPFVVSGRSVEGEPLGFRGIFHTVWKHQPDGTWRFVYD